IVEPVIGGVGDLVEDLLGGLLGQNPPQNPSDDIDVAVHNDIGLPNGDVNLDPLENIVGDIDVGVGITHGDDGIGISLDAVLLDIPLVDADIQLDIPIVNPIVNDVLDAAEPVLSGVTDIAQPVIDTA